MRSERETLKIKAASSFSTAAVIPVYNRAHLIGKAVASVQQQTRPLEEIVVVDNGSIDATSDTVRRLCEQDSRIRLVVLPKNAGPSVARNVGIDSTQCDWISFLDSDDQWTSEKHEKQVSALVNYPDAIASFTGLRYQHQDHYTDRIACSVSLHSLRCLNPFGTTSAAMVRRKALKNVGGFDSKLPTCEDWDLWIRLRSIGAFAVVPDPLVLYSQLEQIRLSHDREAMLSGHYQLFAKILEDIPSERDRRTISAYHKVCLGQNYLYNFREPTRAMVEAIRSLLLKRTREGENLIKGALRASVQNFLVRWHERTHQMTKSDPQNLNS
jgi:glycosyltransferase involved in cell wall biosynthesis